MFCSTLAPDRVAFGLVGVEQAHRRRPLDDLRQLPAQVHRVLHPEVQALPAHRGVHVGGIARHQDASTAVVGRLTGHVGEPGDEARAVRPVVRAVDAEQRGADVLEGRLAGAVPLRFDQGDADPSAFGGADATPAPQTELRDLLHLDLGMDPARRGIPSHEVDAGRLAHDAAAPVTTDQELRPTGRAVRQRDVDAVVVLREAGHLALAPDGNPELVDPAGHDPLDVALQQGQPVVVAGGEVADVQGDTGERLHLHRGPLGEEAVGDATLVQHLDGPRVQPPGAWALELEAGAGLHDEDVGPRQGQLRRQHHPRGSAPGDHHLVPGHRATSPSAPCAATGSTRSPARGWFGMGGDGRWVIGFLTSRDGAGLGRKATSWSAQVGRLPQAPRRGVRFSWRGRGTASADRGVATASWSRSVDDPLIGRPRGFWASRPR